MSTPAPIIEFPPSATSGRIFLSRDGPEPETGPPISRCILWGVDRNSSSFIAPPSLPKTRQFRAKYRKNTSSPMRQNSFGCSFPIGS